jgi:hypothetical protein
VHVVFVRILTTSSALSLLQRTEIFGVSFGQPNMDAKALTMRDDREESKSRDSSPSQRDLGLSKLDAILFCDDKGPAAALLMDGGDMPSPSGKTLDLGSPMPPSTPNVTAQIDAKVSLTTEEMKYRSYIHEKLREQLEKAQADLASERINRKRKEKSLIKLAKELTKRSAEREMKEKAILELSETIDDLESRLGHRNRELVVELPRLKAQCAQHQADLAVYGRDTIELRARLQEARLEADKAKGKLIDHLSTRLSFSEVSFSENSDEVFMTPPPSTTSAPRDVAASYDKLDRTSPSESVFRFTNKLAAVIFCLVLSWGMAVQNEAISMDNLCAPVSPGTKFFRTDEGIYEAPWWAPAVAKEPVFAALCGSRDRVRLQVKNGVVHISKAESGETLWERRSLGGFSVDSDTITVRNWWGSPKQLSAPWSD